MKFRNSLIFILFFVISCRTEVKFDFDKIEPQLVVNSIMQPNQFLRVCLSKSANSLDWVPELIDNAVVELWNNDNFIETLTIDSVGFYSTKNYKTMQLIEYTLKIYVEGFDVVTATDYIPEKQYFEILNFEESSFSNEVSEDFYLLSFSFNNNNSKDKYFQLYFPIKYFSYFKFINSNLYFFSNDLLLKEYNDIFYTNSNTDSIITINLFLNENEYMSGPFNDIKNFMVMNSISENYYNYLKSQKIYNNLVGTDDGMMNDYTLFSNIENGIGIFAGCNPNIDTLIWNSEIVVNK